MRGMLLFGITIALFLAVAPCLAGEPAALFRSVETGADGVSTVTLHGRPVSYLDGTGALLPIDVALVPAEGGYANQTNTLRIALPDRFVDGWTVDPGDAPLRFQPLGMSRIAEDGSTTEMLPDPASEALPGEIPGHLRYDATFDGASDLFEVRGGELKHVVRLDSADCLPGSEGTLELRYRLVVPDGWRVEHHPLTVAEAEGEGAGLISLPYVAILDGSGAARAVVPPPVLWDSSEIPALAGGDLRWEGTGPCEGVLALRISGRILDRMAWPVYVDPQVWQVIGPVGGMVTGSAWGHIEDASGNVLYNVRFNGGWYQVGAIPYDFGPPIGLVMIQDCASTPVFDLSGVPGDVTDAWIEYVAVLDGYGGKEDVVVNDHKSNALDPAISGLVFGNNIADSRNLETWQGITPDFGKDKRYLHAFHGPQETGVFSDEDKCKLVGRALHDIHKSMRGEVDTPSDIPLAPGLFAVAIYDTGEYRASLGLVLLNVRLRFRTN